MTSVTILDEGQYLGAGDSEDIVGWKRADEPIPEGARFNTVQDMRFGELINRIRLDVNTSAVSGYRCVD